MFDTHCHLTFKQFHGREADILSAAAATGVRGVITVSTSSNQARAGLELAERFDNVWCTAGLHPLYADQPNDWDELRIVAGHDKCVAWGELGLDNHYEKPLRAIQDQALSEQLTRIEQWTNEGLDKPIIVHCREAFDELLSVFKAVPFDPSRYVFHCFTGNADEARKVLDFGAWISFTGVVTFNNAPEVREAAKLVPANRIMVETDAPFLSPVPVRKMFPNEPKNVVHTARFMAEIRGVEYRDFEQQLDRNAEQFFGIRIPE